MITGLNHANISTTKLSETIAFFVEVLGLKVGPRPEFSFAGAWLYSGAQPVIHLVERAQPRDPEGAIDHVSFTVPDLAAAMARLDRLGVPYRWSEIPSGFGRQAFVQDPNGITIELTEPGTPFRSGKS
ncbi:MAG TPA: VOC family protein [Hyphomonadaceae bacterium]|jgi:catechol 2,3-dioxygenase-like lactoylglutathione lyase family enzyme|nr:VOC family protein [Hyphomonadaceae bacterium]